MSAATTPTSTIHPLGDAHEYRIPRDGDRDLTFQGWRLSQAKDCKDYSTFRSCTEVSIYLTHGKALVTHVRRWNEDGDVSKDEKHAVAVHSPNDRDPDGYLLNFAGAADAAVEWLKEDNGGRFGTLGKRAWVDACQEYPDLKGKETERID